MAEARHILGGKGMEMKDEFDEAEDERPNREEWDEHHPDCTSRNGDDSKENRKLLPRELLHAPYHGVADNFVTDDTECMIAFCLESLNPFLDPEHVRRDQLQRREHHWKTLLGKENPTKEEAIAVLDQHFVTPSIAARMARIHKIIACAKSNGLWDVNLVENGILTFHAPPQQDQEAVRRYKKSLQDYKQIYNRRKLHEAVIVTVVNWPTFNPIFEALKRRVDRLGDPLVQEESFRKRYKAWVDLMGPARIDNKWDAAKVLVRKFGGAEMRGRHIPDNSVKRAFDLCHELEQLGCLD